MTHCYNCGHTGTFVLLAQFALAVPGPVEDRPARADPHQSSGRRRPSDRRHSRDSRGTSDRGTPDWPRSCDPNRSRHERRGRNADLGRVPSPSREPPSHEAASALEGLPSRGDVSLAVQCPACDSTDVGVEAVELLARYASSTTS